MHHAQPLSPQPAAAATPAERLTVIRDGIAKAAADARRDPAAVTLIAVSKTRTAGEIAPLIAAGQRHFGENRVQEAQAKWPELRAAHGDLRLHLVGQLQSNKADDAVALFDTIHSVDRPRLVDALARAVQRHARTPQLFVQVDLAGERYGGGGERGGCALADLPALLTQARDAGLAVEGLMTVPPLDRSPGPWFALLAEIAARHAIAGLSMGMTADYATAVRLGATHVRVGTALFGERAAMDRPTGP